MYLPPCQQRHATLNMRARALSGAVSAYSARASRLEPTLRRLGPRGSRRIHTHTTWHGMLQHGTACCNMARHVATGHGVLQDGAACCNVAQPCCNRARHAAATWHSHVATWHRMLQQDTACCTMAPHVAPWHSMLQSGAAMLYVVCHSCRATLLRPLCMRLSAVAHPCLSSALPHTAAGEQQRPRPRGCSTQRAKAPCGCQQRTAGTQPMVQRYTAGSLAARRARRTARVVRESALSRVSVHAGVIRVCLRAWVHACVRVGCVCSVVARTHHRT